MSRAYWRSAIEPIWYLFQAKLASEVASISSNFGLGNGRVGSIYPDND